MSTEKDSPLSRKVEDFLQVFKKGEEFTKEIIKENERLRFKLAEHEESIKRTGDDSKSNLYRERLSMLEDELNSLKERFMVVENENKDFAVRYVEVEEENNNLANLYVASYQLHSTLDFNEVLRIILEIIINLIGAEKFGIMLFDEKSLELQAVAAEGVAVSSIPKVTVGEGIIGKVAREGESYFAEDVASRGDVENSIPIVCIPLKIKEHVIGVISIYGLLTQKKTFTNVDYELFNLLAGHAATAVFSSKLYSESERKRTTYQGLLELLKDKSKK